MPDTHCFLDYTPTPKLKQTLFCDLCVCVCVELIALKMFINFGCQNLGTKTPHQSM
jgi:hypothetical protein